MRSVSAVGLLCAALAAPACTDDPLAAGPAMAAADAPRALALVPLDPFGAAERGAGVRGCTGTDFHQFDFWIGHWDVKNSGGGLAGTSVIEQALDGCAIIENWTGASGFQGKSINTFDAATGRWHQMWVDAGGCPNGVITMDGTFANGMMTLQGRREQPLGFQMGPPCGPPPPTVAYALNSIFRWTALPGGAVLQQVGGSSNDDPLPTLADPSTGQGLRYEPVAQVTPIDPQIRSFCPFRGAAKQFDFMLGTWTVHEGEGGGAQGTASYTKSMADCIVEERLAGPGGYQGLSFNTFDVFTQEWIRTFMDTDGRRIYMTGRLDAGRMVFQGSRPAPNGGTVEVRITWEPADVGRVVQRWEYSRDGGASWQAERRIVYRRS